MEAGFAVQSQWPLVGRGESLRRVTDAIRTGAVSVVLLTGASGIGKSRLAAEAASALGIDEWAVLPVAASEMLATTPLGALIPAIAAGRDAFANVGRDSSLALFDIVRDAIDRVANGRRAIFVVDDLTLLDSLSLTVIIQLVAAKLVSLIATVRSGEPLPDAFVSLWTNDNAIRLELAPLTVEDCEEVLAGVLGGRIAHRAAVELHGLSGGNTLFLRELVIGAVEDGQLRVHDGVWQLVGKPLGTPALRDLIRSRLQHLNAEETALLERLAVCQPLTLDDLPDGARPTLIALERLGLVLVEELRWRTMLSLSHPQYAEAIRSSLSRIATKDLLIDQANLVAGRPMNPEDELRVALWRLEAGVESDPAILSRSAHIAFLAGDYARAEILADAAVAAGAPAAEMLFLHGEAAFALGKISDALAVLERATDEDEANPTTIELTGMIAAARASTYAGEVDGNARGLAVLERAEELHPELAGVLALPKAVLLVNLERPELAAEALEFATPGAQTEAGRRAVLDMSRALPLASLGRSDEAIAASRAAVNHAATDPQPAFPIRRAQMVLATVLLQACYLDESLEVTKLSLHDCIQHDDEMATRYNELMLGQIYLAMGRLETAGRWFSDVISGAIARGPAAYIDVARSLLALSLLWRGKASEAAAIVAEIDSRFLSDSSNGAVTALWLDAIRGGRERATATLIRRAREAEGRGHMLMASVQLAAASRLGAAAQAAPMLTALADASSSSMLELQAAHARAEASGRVADLVDIAERWEARGFLLFAAEALVSASAAARRGDSEREAVNLRNRATDILEQCEGADTPLLQFAEGGGQLTQREKEIAALASQGMSSVEIAKKLFLSPRTVNNHLHAAYAKLGIRGRGELKR